MLFNNEKYLIQILAISTINPESSLFSSQGESKL